MNAQRRKWTEHLEGKTNSTACNASRAVKPARRMDVEWEEQCLVVDSFALRHPEFADVLIHAANGGSRRNAFEGWRLKRQGVKKGVSDLFLPVARGGYFGLWGD